MSHPKKPRLSWILVVVLVLENPDRFAIRLTEQISCRTSVSLRSRNPDAPRTSTTTIPNFGIWAQRRLSRGCCAANPTFSTRWAKSRRFERHLSRDSAALFRLTTPHAASTGQVHEIGKRISKRPGD